MPLPLLTGPVMGRSTRMQDPKTKRSISDGDLHGIVNEVARGRISRKQFLTRAAAMGLSTGAIASVLVACSNTTDDTSTDASPAAYASTKPEKVFLYNWSEYMTNECKKGFEKATGIKVVETYFDDNEALLAKLKAGATGYDVAVPSDYMVHILIKTGLLMPLQMDLIPNFEQYVAEKFKDPTYDKSTEFGGLKYSVPYQWGTTGVAVRTDLATEPFTKWAQLWDEQYKGKINMLNDERETIAAGLKKNSYSINSLSMDELTKAKDDLIVQKPLVRQYDSINAKRAMVQGNLLTHCWNGDVVIALWAGLSPKKVDYVMPEEGFPVYVDNLVMPKGAPSPYAAHQLMNYILDPKVQAPLSSWIGYFSPTPDAVPNIDPIVYTYAPTDEDLQRAEIYNDLGEFSRNYTDAWAEVKSA
jgi:spermidine/putrescine transport system substrate-binding protein